MSATALPSLTETIRRHGLAADKRLGQHFLVDPAILARIAAAAEPLAGRTVLEVGPGPGGLTRALLASDAARVVAVEADPRCVAALAELVQVSAGRLEIVAGDALAVDPAARLAGPKAIVANLPYNIATELIVRWLRAPAGIERIVVLVQREVADRLAAAPGTEAYGRLSVLAQWAARVEALFALPPGAFRPPPKVRSRVVRLVPHGTPPVAARLTTLERVTAAAFGQRRKMLRQSLKRVADEPQALCAAAGIDPTARAEALSVAEFCALARSARA